MMKAGIQPSILEFLDRQRGLREGYTGKALLPELPGASILLVELDGSASELRRQRSALRAFMTGKRLSGRLGQRHRQKTLAGPAHLLAINVSLGDTGLNEDVVVPIGKQAELSLHYSLKEIGCRRQRGHAGDGNLHVHIMYNGERRNQAGEARYNKTHEKSGGFRCHYRGAWHRPCENSFMGLQHSAAEIDAMRR